jgi:predicted RecA/RadA family phage recombinase
MATNMIIKNSDQLKIYTNSDVESGETVLVGGITGVALADEDSDGYTVIRREGVFDLSVKAHDGSSDSKVGFGDALYLDVSNGTLNKDSSETLFGYALEEITSGETDTIKVLLK